eukprot:CAMPEP_0201487650 /NCGR_PEP_ID=MMETSP0151_2-20130828/14584_1 /ASSEMBLY_ACC=CAM_ASM_000257 /TAXON_ID=200890 /ORGANISM="Paramoeba atlantica, Strain 621/1 / CCAP 1560/9" /LENGTH=281 /DNA_ID=CAMNT_0047872757 /DNA_START=74 /DNA_END=919 /DNA_ORIENTATION=+
MKVALAIAILFFCCVSTSAPPSPVEKIANVIVAGLKGEEREPLLPSYESIQGLFEMLELSEEASESIIKHVAESGIRLDRLEGDIPGGVPLIRGPAAYFKSQQGDVVIFSAGKPHIQIFFGVISHPQAKIILEVAPEFGYVAVVALLLYLQQNILFSMAVFRARKNTGINPPTLYPRDSEIKELKLNTEEVESYMRTQRVHQNNVEFLSCFYPMMILAGLFNPLHAAVAGAVVFLGRLAYFLGYRVSASARVAGGFFHLGELYTLFLVGSFAYSLIIQINH